MKEIWRMSMGKKKMKGPREILNELKWREDTDLSKAEIWYMHRGAENNTKIIHGDEIRTLERSFIVLDNASIPYHRIFKIVYGGEVVYKKKNLRI